MPAIELPMRTKSEANARDHWAAKCRRVKAQRGATLFALRSHRLPKRLPCVVRLVRLSSGTLDDDNLRSALKAVRDGCADYLEIDDADPRVRWDYGQEKSKRGCYGVRVTIEPVRALGVA